MSKAAEYLRLVNEISKSLEDKKEFLSEPEAVLKSIKIEFKDKLATLDEKYYNKAIIYINTQLGL